MPGRKMSTLEDRAMSKILCATRGGEASYRTQDAVIARAKEEGATILFLYVVDVEFLNKTARAVRPDVMQQEMEKMGRFLLAMACERAAKEGVAAETVLCGGTLAEALIEVAREHEVTLIAFGRPAKGGVFRLADLVRLGQKIEGETGIPTAIIGGDETSPRDEVSPADESSSEDEASPGDESSPGDDSSPTGG
jgi:nucleotide-binding universal stress UspA family protein